MKTRKRIAEGVKTDCRKCPECTDPTADQPYCRKLGTLILWVDNAEYYCPQYKQHEEK